MSPRDLARGPRGHAPALFPIDHSCRSSQGGNVRISCSRYSELKKYTSPYTLLVGPGRTGQWQILEELSESRP